MLFTIWWELDLPTNVFINNLIPKISDFLFIFWILTRNYIRELCVSIIIFSCIKSLFARQSAMVAISYLFKKLLICPHEECSNRFRRTHRNYRVEKKPTPSRFEPGSPDTDMLLTWHREYCVQKWLNISMQRMQVNFIWYFLGQV